MGTAFIVLLVIAGAVFFAQRSFADKKIPTPLPAASDTPTADDVPRQGGTLVEGDVGVPATFNPLLASSQTERDAAALMFDGLVRVDGSGTPTPDLAKSWQVSEDGLTYTVTLRSGVTWHDGSPFTSQDVRFTIGLVQSPSFPGDPQLSRFWRPIVVGTPNDSTVVFHLMNPFSPFLNDLNIPILPKHILGGVTAEDLGVDPFNLFPVGTGPFKFVSYDKQGQQLQLSAYDGYAGDRPHLDAITIKYYGDTDKLLEAVKKGDVQASGTLTDDQLLRAGSIPKSYSIYAPQLMSYTALFFNTRVSPFSNEVVRQALAMAIDPTPLIDGPLKSQAVAGSSPIPSTSWAFSQQGPIFDPQKAAELLDTAGWKYVESDGVRENGESRLSFQLLVNGDDPERVLMAQTIAQQLGGIHVLVDVKEATSDDVNQALAARQFSAAVFGGHFGNGDPDCLDVWSSTQSSTGLNVTGVNDKDIDSALADARATTDVDKRRQFYAQFQRAFVNQAPAVVLYYPRYLFVVSSAVHSVSPDALVDQSDRFQRISSWYLAGETQTATP
ncbi:MAG: peptide ABC transporter substrate-binding protein [Nitrolancea sp.]